MFCAMYLYYPNKLLTLLLGTAAFPDGAGVVIRTDAVQRFFIAKL
jgi:hypothetical protein